MQVFIVNLDSEPERYARTAAAVARFGDVPSRYPAIPEQSVTGQLSEWRGRPVTDQRRRVAIIRTYRQLMADLAGETGDQWCVFQDDVSPFRALERDSAAPLHLYAGMMPAIRGVRAQVNPIGSPHICPKAFRVSRSALPLLEDVWTDETRQSCNSWTVLFKPGFVTFDSPQGVAE
jgi:hypothetical protein